MKKTKNDKKTKNKSYGRKTLKSRGKISLSGKKEENYENGIKDEIDPDKANNDKNLL